MAVVFRLLQRISRDYGQLEVLVGTSTVCRLDNYPVASLAHQLALWCKTVTDEERTDCFVFEPDKDRQLLGSFRIEPRRIGWQFTSLCETRRHDVFMPLTEFVLAARVFIDEIERG